MTSFQVGEPFQQMAVDIAGPFHKSFDGNQYVLVIVDFFTKCAYLISIPGHTAATCAKALVLQVFSKIGLRRSLNSIQGRDFISELFHETCKSFEIEKTKTTIWLPQSDGMVEQLN